MPDTDAHPGTADRCPGKANRSNAASGAKLVYLDENWSFYKTVNIHRREGWDLNVGRRARR